MEQGLVSVVVTTHYRNELLEECLSGVRAQTYEPVEIVVVDGTGEGNAAPVVEDDEDVTFVAMDEDEGPHAARSVGVEHTSGEFVQFCDDDDYLRERKLERQVACLRDEPDAGVVYCGYEDAHGEITLPDESFTGDVLEAALAMETGCCQTTTMLVEGETLREVVPFEHWWTYDDVTLMIELARRTEFAAVYEPLVYRGETDDPLSTRISEVSPIDSAREIVGHYTTLYEDYPHSGRAFLAHAYKSESRSLLLEHYYSLAAIRCYLQAMRLEGSVRARDVFELLSISAGRPGWLLGSRVYETLARRL